MKVKELIELLKECDEDAEVYIMSQPAWPFEYAIKGVTIREDFVDFDDDDVPAEHNGVARSDVFILEGTQLRYGDRDAWNAAR